MHTDPVQITNFSPEANLHRNWNRQVVENIFFKRDKLIRNLEFIKKDTEEAINLQREINRLDFKARQIWRDIVTAANNL